MSVPSPSREYQLMSCRLIFTKGCATLRAMGPCHPAPDLLAKRWRREPMLAFVVVAVL